MSHAKRVYDREKPQENQMQTLSLEIDDNDDYDYENNYPEELVVSSEEEVRARVYEAEKRIENGEFHTEDEYNRLMDKFFACSHAPAWEQIRGRQCKKIYIPTETVGTK